MKQIKIGLILTAMLFALSLNGQSQSNVFDDIIAPSPNHTYLEAAILHEGLEGALEDDQANLTVFFPNNQAFEELAEAIGSDINGLLAIPNLADNLTYHALRSTVPASAVTNDAIIKSLSMTNTLKLTKTNAGDVFVNPAIDKIRIKSNDYLIDAVTMYDLNGRLVLQATLTESNLNDLNILNSGTYILELSSKGQISSQKLHVL